MNTPSGQAGGSWKGSGMTESIGRWRGSWRVFRGRFVLDRSHHHPIGLYPDNPDRPAGLDRHAFAGGVDRAAIDDDDPTGKHGALGAANVAQQTLQVPPVGIVGQRRLRPWERPTAPVCPSNVCGHQRKASTTMVGIPTTETARMASPMPVPCRKPMIMAPSMALAARKPRIPARGRKSPARPGPWPATATGRPKSRDPP